MVFTYKSLVNTEERILLYLLDFDVKEDEINPLEAPIDLTTHGIAEAISTDHRHMAYHIKRLTTQEYIKGLSSRVKGKKRKRKIYLITHQGRQKAMELKEALIDKDIRITKVGQEITRLKLPDVENYLKEAGISSKITFLDICKLTDHNRILDINRITGIKANYIDFTTDAVKPKYFFGRVKELKVLRTWVNDPKRYRIITIHGIAGIGKTTLASKLIEHYRNKKHLFWHNFTNWDTIRSVLSHMIEFFSQIDENSLKMYIDLNQPLELENILSILKDKMKEVNRLFIFDDFHKVNNDLRNFIISLVDIIEKMEKPKFIFISRYNIPFYDQQKLIIKNTVAELEITGLDLESSSEILKKKQLPPEKYQEIYNITTGHPLLLEIIESDKRTRRYIFEEIFSKFATEERIVMEIVSTYRIPIPYDAFFIDDRVSPDSINNLMQKLIIKEPSNGIYTTHEFIKDFFYKRMNPYRKRKYHKFCAEFYLNEKHPGSYLEALFHLIKSMNYKKAIELAIKKSQIIRDLGLSERFIVELEELSDDEIILPQLTDILILKAQLYFITGNWNKSLQNFHRVIEVATEVGKDDIKAKAYCEIGHIQEEQNLIKDALENFHRSLEVAKEINNQKILAEAKRGIGRCYWRKTDYRQAEKYYHESLKELENIDDFKLIGAIYIDIGNIKFETDKNDQAIKYYKKALKYLEKIDDKLEIARAYNNLGTVYIFTKKYEIAIDYYKKQLEIVEAIGDIRLIGYGLSNLSLCYVKSDQITMAEKYIKKAEDIFEKTSNENILFTISFTNALISQFYKDWDKAIDNFNKGITIIKKLDVPFYLAWILYDFGLLFENKNDDKKSRKFYKEAYNIYQKIGRRIPSELEAKLFKSN